MNFILHWCTLPIKITVIATIVFFRSFFTPKKTYSNERPQLNKAMFEHLVIMADKTKYYQDGMLQVNPDHRALRHGSLCYGFRNSEVIHGMSNYINSDFDFIRGPGSPYSAPAAMPMSVAFALAIAHVENYKLDADFITKYLVAVDKLMAKDFAIDKDVSVKLRATSTAFDAIFALSLLSVAFRYSKDVKYWNAINKIMKNYELLLMTPLTYISDKRRNYHIDHIALFGLWSIFQTDCWGWRTGAKNAFEFIYKQSKHVNNPYFDSMACEMGVIDGKHLNNTLSVYSEVSPVKATQIANEFTFDDVKPFEHDPNGYSAVNGLVYAKSILTIMNHV